MLNSGGGDDIVLSTHAKAAVSNYVNSGEKKKKKYAVWLEFECPLKSNREPVGRRVFLSLTGKQLVRYEFSLLKVLRIV